MSISIQRQKSSGYEFVVEMLAFPISHGMADEEKETFAEEAVEEDIDMEDITLDDLPL